MGQGDGKSGVPRGGGSYVAVVQLGRTPPPPPHVVLGPSLLVVPTSIYYDDAVGIVYSVVRAPVQSFDCPRLVNAQVVTLERITITHLSIFMIYLLLERESAKRFVRAGISAEMAAWQGSKPHHT